MKDVTAEMIELTPELARQLLERQLPNRRLHPPRVDANEAADGYENHEANEKREEGA